MRQDANKTMTLRLYGLALRLYPAAFRERYAAEMLEAARREQAEGRAGLGIGLAWDTAQSLLREHWRAAAAGRPGYMLLLAMFCSVVLLGVYVVDQQILRRGADELPGQIVAEVRGEMAHGAEAAAVLSGPKQEVSSPEWLAGKSAFCAVYDADGKAVASDATLWGELPQPPHGIFNVIRDRGWDKVTWQPQPGIRVALTGMPLPNGGYVLAGQSLIPGEARTARFSVLMRWVWLAMLAGCVAVMLLLRARARSSIRG
jgi:hypothetical protein